MANPAILFVDDEPNILRGLSRLLYTERRRWDLLFAADAETALEIAASRPVEVVVSDLRMPGRDGLSLLETFTQRYPATIRMVLSGDADRNRHVTALGVVHQFLTKPFDGEQLKSKLERAFRLRALVPDERFRTLAGRLGRLPTLPDVYLKVERMLEDPNVSLKDVGETISSDPSITARLLQLANSALFQGSAAVGIMRAVERLGADLVRTMLLTAHLFSFPDPRAAATLNLTKLWNRSLEAASLTRQICRSEGLASAVGQASFTAAILRDIGQLVLAANLAEQYADTLRVAQEEDRPFWEKEQETWGVTHAEIGAYLVGIWGLQDETVEILAYHHQPSERMGAPMVSLGVVHAADAIVHNPDDPHPDWEYIRACGLSGNLTDWKNCPVV